MLVLALLLLAGDVATPPPSPAAGAEVLVWRRAPGPAAKDPKAASARVRLSALPHDERTMKDARGNSLRVRGVSLSAILRAAPARSTTEKGARHEDTAVLRFKNGARVALAFTDVKRVDVFIATSLRHSDQGAWTSVLEPVPVGPAAWKGARALTFSGNRVLASQPVSGVFNPWPFVDSLIEVELVNAAAWRRVFLLGDDDKALEVFESRCAACHGARNAGASLGWDFVDPLPLASWRTPESLFDHVRAHKLSDAEQGLLMPAQTDVTREQISLLHGWMTRLSKEDLRDYAP